MRRALVIVLSLLAVAAVVLIPSATGADDGPYKVRGIFDNGAFIVNDEEVRVAGATVGTVESVDVTGPDEIASLEGGPHAVPGKAVVVMNITDDAFKDFRADASCIVRPQSLIGEKLVDCTPTQPRAPGTEPPPELEEIDEGPGEGQRLLPLENNGKTVDIDLINNINRASYRDRFRLILNDLGAGLAARGDDLGDIIDRANPALRQTNRVLKILADQDDRLASLASDGDTVLEPLAQNRSSITGFFRNAAIAGQATAERGDDLEAQIEKFPETLRQVRATMKDLRGFADQGTPLMEDIGAVAPDLSKATQNLPAFFRAGLPAFTTPRGRRRDRRAQAGRRRPGRRPDPQPHQQGRPHGHRPRRPAQHLQRHRRLPAPDGLHLQLVGQHQRLRPVTGTSSARSASAATASTSTRRCSRSLRGLLRPLGQQRHLADREAEAQTTSPESEPRAQRRARAAAARRGGHPRARPARGGADRDHAHRARRPRRGAGPER